SPMDDTPASKVGLRAGDRIMFIDGTDTKGMSIKDASKYLRGKEGTKVVLKIKRIGSEELLKFSLTRKNINVRNIPFSAVMDNGIGYIKLTQFTATSYYNFVNEFEKLVFNGASSLIVDLRFNPGGLLQSAVKLCSVFLPEDKVVVYTRGRGDNINGEYTTYLTPLDTEIPIVVLVNGSSASASEIFAGSLQDHDRAVIIGEPTFGKGLVQQLFDVGNLKKRNLKMTVRKYYTASGRLIQKDDIFKDNEQNGNDTLFYNTLVNKRKVPTGMGIIPDVLVEPVRIPEYIVSLKMNNYFNDFLYYFLEKVPGHTYEGYVDDKMMESFGSYLEREGFNYKSKSEILADSLLNRAEAEDHSEEIIKNIKKAVESFKTAADKDFNEYSDEIKKNLNTEFSVYYFGNREKYKISNEFDPVVRKAVEILMDKNKYQTILGY
ncbi:MAG: S41 family peptidase, partial [Candidatus Delongbacteria bacterium]